MKEPKKILRDLLETLSKFTEKVYIIKYKLISVYHK